MSYGTVSRGTGSVLYEISLGTVAASAADAVYPIPELYMPPSAAVAEGLAKLCVS